jgi:photosystem II stability/assembly factor-like uncharacterized protein
MTLNACTQVTPAAILPTDTQPAKLTSTPEIAGKTATPPVTLPPSQEKIYYSALSPDQTRLAVLSSNDFYHANGKLWVYKISEPGAAPELLWGTASREGITDLKFSPDGNLMAIVLDGSFLVWLDANTGQPIHVFRSNQSNPVLSLQQDGPRNVPNTRSLFSPDGRRLFTWNRGTSILSWDTGTGERVENFTGMSDGFLINAALSGDGKTLAARFNDQIDVWDVETHTLTHVVPAPLGESSEPDATRSWLAISPEGSSIASGNMGQVQIWDLAQDRSSGSFPVPESYYDAWFPTNIAFTADGTHLILPLAHAVAVYRISDGQRIFEIPVSGEYPQYDFSLLPGNVVSLFDFAASSSSTWDANTGTQLSSASLPINGEVTTDTFRSIPPFNQFGDIERFTMTLPPTDIAFIKRIDETTGWGVATNGWILHTGDAGKTWQNVSPTGWDFHTQDFFALDADHAWIVQYAFQPVIWHTSDGGRSWEQDELEGMDGTRGYTIRFDFTDAQHGLFLWAEQGNHGSSTPHLQNTGDGGKTWETLAEFDVLGFTRYTGLLFLNESTGFLSGMLGGFPENYMGLPTMGDYISGKALPALQKTTDGGRTWFSVQLPRLALLPAEMQAPENLDKQMYCGVESLGRAHLYSSRIVASVLCTGEGFQRYTFDYFSPDGGESWFLWQPGPQDFAVNDYIDASTGWRQIRGQDSFFIQMTTDDGQVWNTVAATPWRAVQLDFVNETTGWALAGSEDQYMLYQTTDGGQTWEQIKPVLSP